MKFNFFKREKKELPSGKIIFTNKGVAIWNKRNFETLAQDGYQRNVIAYAAINKIKRCVAGLEFCVYRDGKNGKEKVDQNHPMLKLFYNPNKLQSKEEFLGELVSDFCLSGNAFVQKNETSIPLELFVITPEYVKVIQGNTGYPEGYSIQANGGIINYPFDIGTGKSEILHIKDYAPKDRLFGQSPLEAAAQSVDIFNEGQLWNYNLLKNGGEPSGVLKTSDTITDEQYDELKNMLSSTSGSRNAGKKLILEGGLEYQQTGLNAKDMDFKEAQMLNARFIALAFGVPPQVINLAGADSTFSNYEQATYSFYEDTILPITKTILNAFNRWLPLYYKEEGLYIDIDYNSIKALDYKRAEKEQSVATLKQNGILSTNEARKALDYEVYEQGGGDVILTPAGNLPLEYVASGDSVIDEAEQGFLNEQATESEN